MDGAELAKGQGHAPPQVHEGGPARRRICMFVYNAFVNDIRVVKEASSLVASGHEVLLVAVLDRRTVEREEHPAGFTVIRIDRNPPHYRLLRRTRLARRWLRLRRARVRRAVGSPRRFARGRRYLWIRGRRSNAAPTGEVRSGSPRRLYRAVRWRVLRRVPAARRTYYRRRAESARQLAARSYRERAKKQLPAGERTRKGMSAAVPKPRDAATTSLGPESRRAAWPARILAAPLALPVVVGRVLARAGAWLDRRVSRLAYRSVMVFHKPLMFTDYYRRAYRLVRDEGFDSFHAHDLNTLPVAAWLARRTRQQLVYDAHELYTEISTLSRLERWVWRRIERPLIRRANHVITVCESIADELSTRYRVPKPVILLNCPPARDSAPWLGANQLRVKAGLTDTDEPIVLYQGGFSPNRGIEQLIDAAQFFDRGVLLLMGWGAIEGDLARRIEEQGLAGRVMITGPAAQSELVEFTAGADVGVIPYRPVGLNNYYTTPNKLFDYIAAGIAVAGSSLPELKRFVEEPRIGVMFDPDDPRDIARAINTILADPAELTEMKVRAQAMATRFVWESEAQKLLGLYSQEGAESDSRR